MQFSQFFKAALMTTTSALALGVGMSIAHAQPTNITGLYGGVGFGWETNSGGVKLESTHSGNFEFDKNLSSSGIFGNLFAGYRVPVFGPWVFGGEVKFNFGGSHGEVIHAAQAEHHLSTHGRFGVNIALTAGFLMPNGMLPFAKIGYAGKTVKLVGCSPSVGSAFNSTKWLSGIEFGAGIDIPIGIIGGALNMPAFLRADLSYTTYFAGGKFCSQFNACDSGHIKYSPDTFQAGVALGLRF